jgi:hypothetical protein
MQMVVRKKLTPSRIYMGRVLHKNFHKRKVSRKMMKGNQIIVLTMKEPERILQTGEKFPLL